MMRQIQVFAVMLAVIMLSCSVGLADTVTDYSGNSNDGTSFGGTSIVTEGGISSFYFDGSGDYIAAPNLGTSLSAGTIAAWVKLDTMVGNVAGQAWSDSLFGTSVWENGAFHVELFDANATAATSDNAISGIARYSDSGRAFAHTGWAPALDEWLHIAYSFGVTSGNDYATQIVVTDTSGNATVYTGDTYDAGYAYNLSSLCFAGLPGDSRYMNGNMTDLRVYTEALSTSDIALLADADLSSAPSATNLVAHYLPGSATAVPEPSTLVLILGLALAGLLIRKK